MEIYEDLTVIPLATYGDLSGATPANTVSSPMQAALGATGLVVTLYAKTAVTSTLALFLVGIEGFESQEFVMNVSKTVTTASRYVWLFYPGAAPTPAGEGAATLLNTVVQQCVGAPIPDRYKIRVTKGDTSAWVFGVSARRLP
jgi:hypothetical protein